MRVLGLDLGMKRTGMAVSDELGLTVRALPLLVATSRADAVSQILALATNLEVRAIVVGYPLKPKSKEEGPMAIRARGLKEALEADIKAAGLPILVHLQDETYSSKEALFRLRESGVRKEQRRHLLDSEAARILVEQFLAEESTHDAT